MKTLVKTLLIGCFVSAYLYGQGCGLLVVNPTTFQLDCVGTGAGTGSVTSVSVVTANGISGSVANATTTPAITLTLGAITPSSVTSTFTGNLTGDVTGNVSGTAATFTGNLTGDVTSVGMATTLSASGVVAGGCGDTTHSCSIVVDSKGRVTTLSDNVIVAPSAAGVPPYSTTAITSSPMTILAATHGQGLYAFIECYDTSTPRVAMECSWTRNAAGDVVVTYVDAPGQIDIFGSTGATVVNPTPGYSPNQPLAGCAVEYISGLIFNVGSCVFTINGLTYTSPITQVTLTASDPTNPRIDVIGVDNLLLTSGEVYSEAGIPAGSPAQPDINPATQLGLIQVNVAAGATTPTGISLVSIYEENTEWTTAVTSNLNAASTSNPYRGTKDVEATAAVLGNNVTFTKPAAGTENLANWNTCVCYLRSKAQWATGNSGANAARVLNVSWLNGATAVGVPVIIRDGVFNFSSGTLGVYQQISIPTSLFGTGSNLVTTLKIQVAGNSGSSSIGFYLDACSLQGGAVPILFPTTSMNFKGTWASSAAYSKNDVVVSSDVGYVALTANTNVAVSTTATWARLAATALTATAFANQGTTTTLLHGNAAGNLSFGAIVNADITNSTIDLTAKVTGLLPTANMAAPALVRSCTVIIGDPGAASSVLANDNDSPVACNNNFGADWTITSVGCWADAGSPTVTPILTGGSSTSVLTGALTCGTASWAAGTVQGTAPVVHSFSGGATCSSTPCSIDANITTAGGTAKYIVMKIVGTL